MNNVQCSYLTEEGGELYINLILDEAKFEKYKISVIASARLVESAIDIGMKRMRAKALAKGD